MFPLRTLLHLVPAPALPETRTHAHAHTPHVTRTHTHPMTNIELQSARNDSKAMPALIPVLITVGLVCMHRYGPCINSPPFSMSICGCGGGTVFSLLPCLKYHTLHFLISISLSLSSFSRPIPSVRSVSNTTHRLKRANSRPCDAMGVSMAAVRWTYSKAKAHSSSRFFSGAAASGGRHTAGVVPVNWYSHFSSSCTVRISFSVPHDQTT